MYNTARDLVVVVDRVNGKLSYAAECNKGCKNGFTRGKIKDERVERKDGKGQTSRCRQAI